MKIRVFADRCEGHGQCYLTDVDLYPLDDEGRIALKDGTDVPSGQEKLARQGALACPVAALDVEN